MSSLVDFQDLDLLDGGDLRAVFEQVPEPQVLAALAGTPAGLRRRLLTKLSSSSADRLQSRISDHGPVSSDTAEAAQRTVVETLCRLGRNGQVAFDDPADMMVA